MICEVLCVYIYIYIYFTAPLGAPCVYTLGLLKRFTMTFNLAYQGQHYFVHGSIATHSMNSCSMALLARDIYDI